MPLFRPPLILRLWRKDEAGVATRSQRDVDPSTDLPIELKGQDRQFRGPGQWATYDYPNPPGARRSISLLTWTDSFKLPLTTHTPKGRQQDWPVPRVDHRRSISLFTHTYLALALTVAPFHQTDWPNPRGAARSNDLITRISSGNVLTATQTTMGTNQYDWPNPRGAAPTLWRGWTDSFKLPLQTIEPNNQYDWPVPKGAKPVVADWQDSFTLPLQETIQPNQYDWPVPRGYIPGIDLRTWLQTGYLEEFGEPFNQTDWPVPKGAKPVGLSWTDSYKLPPTTFPYNQADWPVPKGREPLNRGFTDSFKLTLTGLPPADYDWPNPRGPQQPNLGWTESFKRTLLGQDQLPFRQSEWVVPRAPVPPPQWTYSFRFSLTTLIGFNQYEWPNPRGFAPTQWRGWTDSFKLPLQAITPSNQYDWPNPPRGKQPLAPAWSDSFKLTLTTIRPLSQRDWPNPGRPRRAESLTWLEGNHFALYQLASVKPHKQTEWPNPTLAKARHQDWVVAWPRTNATSSVTPPINIQRDWPNPVRARVKRQDFIYNNALLVSARKPFTIYWPNPVLPTLRVTYGFEQSTGTQLRPVVVPPSPPPPPTPAKRADVSVTSGFVREAGVRGACGFQNDAFQITAFQVCFGPFKPFERTTTSGRTVSTRTSSRWGRSTTSTKRKTKTTVKDDP